MLASELIEELQKLIEQYGDCEVSTSDDGGAYGDFPIGGIDIVNAEDDENHFVIY